MLFRITTIIAVSLLTVLPTSAVSADISEDSTISSASANIPVMEQVTVVGQPEDQLTGSNSLDREQLDKLPVKDGSINETISIFPGIQLTEQGRSSTTEGEILPPEISISGGKSYQNNILIDGISNNNLLDPGLNDPSSIMFVPAHSQSMFIDSSLVQSIDVYRYNIPASYGGFTGGVVDVKLRDPEPVFLGEGTYKTTRDSWARFHLDENIDDDFRNSNSVRFQPQFQKHKGGLIVNTPINSELRILTAYHASYSKIPLNHLGEEKTQHRRNDNFLAKLAYDLNDSATLIADLQYSPYTSKLFYPNSYAGDIEIEGGGLRVGLALEKEFQYGDLILRSAWKDSRNNRKAAPDLRPWVVSTTKPWGGLVGSMVGSTPVSFEGSVGSMKTSQEGFQFNADFVGTSFLTGQVSHQFNLGLDYNYIEGTLERLEETNQYYKATQNPTISCPTEYEGYDCISLEQYFTRRLNFAADSVEANMSLVDFYIDDKMQWKRLELRPGLRISYDDFMENINLAPRFAASYDLFGNGNSVLIGGLNRYYGKTLMAYKLREGSQPSQDQRRDPATLEWYDRPPFVLASRNFVNDWRGRPFIYSELDTPYTDETVLGLDQELLGGRLTLVWLHREGKDEFSQEAVDLPAVLDDGTEYEKTTYRLTNFGESIHDEYSAEWERTWRNHYLMINATYQESEASNESYSDSFDLEDINTTIWYEGELVDISALPRNNFNRPWIVNLTYATRLPWGVTFTNVTKYKSGYLGISDKITDPAERAELRIPDGYDAYKEEQKKAAIIFDWRIDWEKKLTRNKILKLTLEVDNVFDYKAQTGDPTDQLTYQTYELGRQFWLGMTYKF